MRPGASGGRYGWSGNCIWFRAAAALSEPGPIGIGVWPPHLPRRVAPGAAGRDLSNCRAFSWQPSGKVAQGCWCRTRRHRSGREMGVGEVADGDADGMGGELGVPVDRAAADRTEMVVDPAALSGARGATSRCSCRQGMPRRISASRTTPRRRCRCPSGIPCSCRRRRNRARRSW